MPTYLSDLSVTSGLEDTGNTITNGTNLQNSINAASAGDTLVLQSGITYEFTTDLTLPNKGAAISPITIRPSLGSQLPHSTERVIPGTHVNGKMAKLVFATEKAVNLADGANGYTLIGIEITGKVTDSASSTNALFQGGLEASYANLALMINVVVDRCFLHSPETSYNDLAPVSRLSRRPRVIWPNFSKFILKNSYLTSSGSEDAAGGQAASAQTYLCVGGATDHLVENNYLEGYYAPFFTGGGDSGKNPTFSGVVQASPAPTIGSATLSSVEGIRVGTLIAFVVPTYADPTTLSRSVGTVTAINGLAITFDATESDEQKWPNAPSVGGTAYWNGDNVKGFKIIRNKIVQSRDDQASDTFDYKGFGEFKSAVDFLIYGNLFYSSKANGAPLMFLGVNQNGGAPWMTINNVIIRNNWFRYGGHFTFFRMGTEYYNITTPGANIIVDNNISEGAPSSSWTNHLGGGSNVVVRHNTTINASSTVAYAVDQAVTGFDLRDNVLKGDTISGDPVTPFPSIVCLNNMSIGGASLVGSNHVYPADTTAAKFINYGGRDYRLAGDSPGKDTASDGKDIGADFIELYNAMNDWPISVIPGQKNKLNASLEF